MTVFIEIGGVRYLSDNGKSYVGLSRFHDVHWNREFLDSLVKKTVRC